MTEEKKQKLKQLLEEAITCLEIRERVGDKISLAIDVYKKLLQKRWTSYSLDSLQVIAYKPYVMNEKIKFQLLDFIKTELAPFIDEDKILSASYFILGDITDRFPLDKLLEQLIRIAIVYGMESAVSDFKRCAGQTQGSFQVMALLQGIRLEKAIQVSEGIRLVPLTNSPSKLPYNVPDLSNPVHDMPKNLYSKKTLLIVDCSISPVFHKPVPDAFRSRLQGDAGPFRVKLCGENSPNLNVDDFYKYFCQALSIACNSPVQIALRWRFLKEDTLFNLSASGFSGTSYVHHSFQDRFQKVGQTQIHKAKCLYDNLANLKSNIAEKLQIPIDRWIKSKISGNSEDKIIDLAIAFETLYLPDIGESAFKLAVRASWYLGEDRGNRVELFEVFREFYKCRSKIVHRGERKENITIEGESVTIEKFITRVQDLCRDSIEKIIKQCSREGKFPKNDYWDGLILGEESL